MSWEDRGDSGLLPEGWRAARLSTQEHLSPTRGKWAVSERGPALSPGPSQSLEQAWHTVGSALWTLLGGFSTGGASWLLTAKKKATEPRGAVVESGPTPPVRSLQPLLLNLHSNPLHGVGPPVLGELVAGTASSSFPAQDRWPLGLSRGLCAELLARHCNLRRPFTCGKCAPPVAMVKPGSDGAWSRGARWAQGARQWQNWLLPLSVALGPRNLSSPFHALCKVVSSPVFSAHLRGPRS